MAHDETAAPSSPLPPEPITPRLAFHETPWFWLGFLFVLGMVAVSAPVHNAPVAFLGTLLVMVLHVIGTVQVAARAPLLRLSVGKQIAAFFTCALLFLIMLLLFRPLLEGAMRSFPGGRPPDSLRFVGHLNFVARPLFLLMAAVLGGQIVARLIKSPNMLGPVCAVVALIDIWGVLFSGPTAQMLDKAPEVAKAVMPGLPTAGGAAAAAQFNINVVSVGPGDYLFLGLLFAALHQLHMNWRTPIWVVTPLIVVALLSISLNANIMLPGLLFIGLGIALPNWRYFNYTREEKFALMYAGVFVVILSIGIYFMVKSALPDKPPGKPQSANAAGGSGGNASNAPLPPSLNRAAHPPPTGG